MNDPPRRLTAEMFDPLIDGAFAFHVRSEKIANAKLIEIKRLPPSTERKDLPVRQDPFSLIFKVVGDVQLEQGTYEVVHETDGTTEMFLVPVGFDEYQAIFN